MKCISTIHRRRYKQFVWQTSSIFAHIQCVCIAPRRVSVCCIHRYKVCVLELARVMDAVSFIHIYIYVRISIHICARIYERSRINECKSMTKIYDEFRKPAARKLTNLHKNWFRLGRFIRIKKNTERLFLDSLYESLLRFRSDRYSLLFYDLIDCIYIDMRESYFVLISCLKNRGFF